jgi:HlyD family secretion protein
MGTPVKLPKGKWLWVGGVALAVVLFAAFGLNRKPATQYFTTPVGRGDIRDVVEATGTINAVTTVQVGSQVSGTIAKLSADFNSHVKKGQVIAQIDPSLFQGAVLQARADLENARATWPRPGPTWRSHGPPRSRPRRILSATWRWRKRE